MSENAPKKTLGWIGTVLLLLIGAVGGHMGTDFFNFQAEQRKEINKAHEDFQKAVSSINSALLPFVDVAKADISAVKDEDRKTIRTQMNLLFQDADTIAKLIPETRSTFEPYSEAMVKLQKEALDLKGPIDGKQFVEATGEFLYWQNEFDKSIISFKQSYKWSLPFPLISQSS